MTPGKVKVHTADVFYCGRYGVRNDMSFEASEVVIDLPDEYLSRIFLAAEFLDISREPVAKSPWGGQSVSIG